MIKPGRLAEFVGFTEDEVKDLCEKYDMDFDEMKRWYDGYSFTKIKSVYAPNSVVKAIDNEEFGSYWTATGTYESIRKAIDYDFIGLRDDIISLFE